jgi:NAD(P)-dependent dehydrogenase (short-subunit alcohol dehydrogenase family)
MLGDVATSTIYKMKDRGLLETRKGPSAPRGLKDKIAQVAIADLKPKAPRRAHWAHARSLHGKVASTSWRRLMEQSGGGSIVNISSVAGLRGSPGAIAYSATKWALRGMTKAAAIDLAPRKIRVNSVHPGPIDTEMLKVRTPEQNQQRLQLVPMKRMGTAEEVASLVLFLLSDESGYITGAEVAIDGGVSL